MSKIRNDTGLDAIRIEGGLLSSAQLNTLRHYQLPGQSQEAYGLEKGLRLSDELGRFWRIAQARWEQFAELRRRQDLNLDTAAVETWLAPLLTRVLGFQLQTSSLVRVGERTFPITHTGCNGVVPLVLIGPEHDLDKGSPLFGEERHKRSPAGLLQEYLNVENNCLWGMVSNGLTLRLLRDNPAMTRPAYLEIDLERIFTEELYTDFTVFWLLLHASRFEPPDSSLDRCYLEQWRQQGQTDGERVLGELRVGVTAALRLLGTGLVSHPGNNALRAALLDQSLSKDKFFQELLRLIYRLLFLFTAEDRNIHLDPGAEPAARELYRQGYSLGKLRERARFRRYRDNHTDAWQQLLITFAGFAVGQPRLAQPPLGGLFAADQCLRLDQATLANRYLYEAIFKLGYFEYKGRLARINYRDMDTEELGSVYESLLELIPELSVEGTWSFGFQGDNEEGGGTGHARKLTGSYYTPDSLVQELIQSALLPVLEARLKANQADPRDALLSITVCDPACGSGHFLLAAARRLAANLARIEAGTDQPSEVHYRHALREVVSHCIYGVDLNPMAVELCRTALWLETIEPGKPLGFLDAHIRHGNSLIGLLDSKLLAEGIPHEAYKPLIGDERETATELKKENRQAAKGKQMLLFNREGLAALSACALDLDVMPEENLEQVQKKSEAWQRIRHSAECRREHLKAHIFTAAFFAIKTSVGRAAVPTSVDLARLGQGMQLAPQLDHALDELANEHSFFHWHLAFPEVFGEERGGFDVVLANPPWERIKLQEQEFFASRSPEIAKASNAAARSRMIIRLSLDSATPAEKMLYKDFLKAKHSAEAASQFIRTSGHYPLTGKGDINTYALFAEIISQIVSPQGRAGFIVPSGLAIDDTTKDFFGALIANQTLESFFEFENEGFFPGAGQGHMLRFALTTIVGAAAKVRESRFLFQGKRLEELTSEDRVFSLSPSEIFLVNPNTLTCPIFRSRRDAELTKAIYTRIPVLMRDAVGDAPGHNPWGISFMRMFDMANASHLFKTKADLLGEGCELIGNCFMQGAERFVPLYEAKMIHQYNHRHGDFYDAAEGERIHVLPAIPEERLRDTDYLTLPFYWISEAEVDQLLSKKGWYAKWLIGWRDVTDARASARTLIASVIPRAGVNDKFLLMLPTTSARHAAALLGNLCSLVCDYVARQKVGGLALKYFTLKQFPVLAPDDYTEADLNFIVPRILKLTYTSSDLEGWAKDLGYEGAPFQFDSERRAVLRAELDVYYAHLYDLSLDDMRFILDPQSVNPGYPSETFAVLKRSDERKFGEYRTQRLILDAWDRLAGAVTIAKVVPEADVSLYPETAAHWAICAVALTLVRQSGGIGSMDHLDALILAARPELCRKFLNSMGHQTLDAALVSAPKALWADSNQDIRWKECRDYLEDRQAVSIRHGVKDQPIVAGPNLSAVQETLPGQVDEIARIALIALARVRELRLTRIDATPEQERMLNILDNNHHVYQLVA
jgi:hypothetical protein